MKYWEGLAFSPKWEAANDVGKLEDWREIKESYEYYVTPQKVEINGKEELRYPIHSLFSNIGIKYNGKWASELSFEHLCQIDRIPSYSICFVDETGTVYSIEYSTNKMLAMEDDLKFIRQFRENILYGTEQDANYMANGFRRIVGQNDNMQGCKTKLKPLLLRALRYPFQKLILWLLRKNEYSKKKFWKKLLRFSLFLAPFVVFLNSLINSVGFVRFKYRPEGSTVHEQEVGSVQTFIMPMTPNLHYDTRAYRRLYNCWDKPITGSVHKSLTMENTEKNRQAFLRAGFYLRPEYDPDRIREEEERELKEADRAEREALKEAEAYRGQEALELARLVMRNPALAEEAHKEVKERVKKQKEIAAALENDDDFLVYIKNKLSL